MFELIRLTPQRSTILELAGGRGGDLHKIRVRRPVEVLLVDIDRVCRALPRPSTYIHAYMHAYIHTLIHYIHTYIHT